MSTSRDEAETKEAKGSVMEAIGKITGEAPVEHAGASKKRAGRAERAAIRTRNRARGAQD